ncbi:hypothetical protein GCM10010420_56760 [Streptomyces glaucosporus]|uniref:Uncharacterized protein n=2 Tax=Streptomyces glaucosporus TaxID=284044 RepID=A0ABN3J0A7_9ACTN
MIIPGEQLDDPEVIRVLTADESNIADWGKYSTRVHQSPYGDFQVHYCYNSKKGEVSYDIDYKAVMNRRW